MLSKKLLTMRTGLALFTGYLIQTFDPPPLIVTLAGLYLAQRPVLHRQPLHDRNHECNLQDCSARVGLYLWHQFPSPGALIAIAVVLTGFSFGGDEQSVLLTYTIATLVIGGTLLTSSVGNVFGTVLGVLVYRDHPGAHSFSGHAGLVVDPHRHRLSRLRVLPDAEAVGAEGERPGYAQRCHRDRLSRAACSEGR